MNDKKYMVRQYRPAYFEGFENEVVRDVPYDEITTVSFCDNFKYDGFVCFSLDPYGSELIISAHYKDGKQYVVGFALPIDSDAVAPEGGLMRDNWRYNPMAASERENEQPLRIVLK